MCVLDRSAIVMDCHISLKVNCVLITYWFTTLNSLTSHNAFGSSQEVQKSEKYITFSQMKVDFMFLCGFPWITHSSQISINVDTLAWNPGALYCRDIWGDIYWMGLHMHTHTQIHFLTVLTLSNSDNWVMSFPYLFFIFKVIYLFVCFLKRTGLSVYTISMAVLVTGCLLSLY